MQQEHRECIEQCYECAAACDICASSCLREDNVEIYLQSLRRRVCKARSRPLPELRAGMQPMCRRLP